VSAVVTSPCKLGVQHRSYDTPPRARYLDWTGEWTGRSAGRQPRVAFSKRRRGDRPLTAMEVAQAARDHLQLQNTIH
jgi:hypothetical protein